MLKLGIEIAYEFVLNKLCNGWKKWKQKLTKDM